MSSQCRRQIHSVFIIVVAGVLATMPGASAVAASPMKIGMALPYTGPFASIAQDVERGFKLYMESIDWKVAGTTVTLITEDTAAKPDVGLTKIRKLVERDQVHVLTGLVSSAVGYAVRDYVDAKKVPLVISVAGASDLTQRKASPYIFRVGEAINQEAYPFGPWAYSSLGYRKAIIMASDFAAGHEFAGAFKKGFTDKGGEVVKEIYPPLGTTDFGPYLAPLMREKADAVYAFFAGSDAIRFVKQYAEYGLKARMPLIASSALVDETIMPAQGDAALGIIVGDVYSVADDTPENKRFVRSYRDKYGSNPSEYSASGYYSAVVIAEALKITKGETSPEKFVEALRRVDIVAPARRLKFDRLGQTVFTLFPAKVEKRGGVLVKTPLGKVEDIGQDVIYKP